MANQVPINDDEIINYMVDGVPDSRLRDQARLQRFTEITEMLKPFQNMNLSNDSKVERNHGKNQQKIKKKAKPASTELTAADSMKKIFKCFNCKEPKHRTTDCKKPCKIMVQ